MPQPSPLSAGLLARHRSQIAGNLLPTLKSGIAVLGVSIDVDADAYHRFLKDYKVGFVNVRDPEQKSATLYGTHGWPETYIIDRNGIVRRKFIGPVDWGQPKIVEFLSEL